MQTAGAGHLPHLGRGLAGKPLELGLEAQTLHRTALHGASRARRQSPTVKGTPASPGYGGEEKDKIRGAGFWDFLPELQFLNDFMQESWVLRLALLQSNCMS